MGIELPEKVCEFKLLDFTEWLEANGAHLLPPSNTWEIVRYRSVSQTNDTPGFGEGMRVHIVYRNKKNRVSSWTGWSNKHYLDFLKGKSLGEPNVPIPPKKHGAKKKYAPGQPKKLKDALLERDGDECFFCGKVMPDDDRTLEHLIAKAKGGGNEMVNYALAHAKCNQAAGDKDLAEKIAFRDTLRYGGSNEAS